ncbi:hypothetical protein RJ639_021007 [Escallonia herrerae]|uniref:SAWADEE domain-containing protein n=1 Tax=Escallonia herrerae TaxID=1293975 RepID=A0AA88V509_9ASTE|nr:hypothetical protein RJ639_021007 [Escallonia herrerae]
MPVLVLKEPQFNYLHIPSRKYVGSNNYHDESLFIFLKSTKDMDWLESTEMGDDTPEFTLAEIMEMENFYKELGEKSLSWEFCRELAITFSGSTHRTGKSAIKGEQVQDWFQDKQRKLAAKFALREVVAPSDATRTKTAPDNFSLLSLKELADSRKRKSAAAILQKPKETPCFLGVLEVLFIALEMRSFQKANCYSEVEARVRFAGFRNVEDEWVNVRRAVRERSIPLEPSECHRVKAGDLVLCFRESDDNALYCDAYILEVQRLMHEVTDCSCIFVVRYALDNVEVVNIVVAMLTNDLILSSSRLRGGDETIHVQHPQ